MFNAFLNSLLSYTFNTCASVKFNILLPLRFRLVGLSDKRSKTNLFEIVGIAVGGCVVLILSAVSLFIVTQRYRRKRYAVRGAKIPNLLLVNINIIYIYYPSAIWFQSKLIGKTKIFPKLSRFSYSNGIFNFGFIIELPTRHHQLLKIKATINTRHWKRILVDVMPAHLWRSKCLICRIQIWTNMFNYRFQLINNVSHACADQNHLWRRVKR